MVSLIVVVVFVEGLAVVVLAILDGDGQQIREENRKRTEAMHRRQREDFKRAYEAEQRFKDEQFKRWGRAYKGALALAEEQATKEGRELSKEEKDAIHLHYFPKEKAQPAPNVWTGGGADSVGQLPPVVPSLDPSKERGQEAPESHRRMREDRLREMQIEAHLKRRRQQ